MKSGIVFIVIHVQIYFISKTLSLKRDLVIKMIKSPVLLITFNRPDTTQKVFDALKKAKPEKLYFFNDGPRLGNKQDFKAREKIKRILDQVDWECELSTNYSEKNLGCELGVSGAISWVLEKEESVIIVEDDVVPAISFFYFAQEILEMYKFDKRIGMVSGNNYTPIKFNEADYIFSKYAHIWGWATWKRVWEKFDVTVPDLQKDLKNGLIKKIFHKREERKYFNYYFNRMFLAIKNKTINTWDTQFFYFLIRNEFLSIVPRVNLVTNIGVEGTHTGDINSAHFWPTDEAFVLHKHPNKVECNTEYDYYHFKNHLNKAIKKKHILIRAKNKFLRLLKQL